MQADGHLAVGDLTQGTAILPGDPHRMLAGLREARLVDDPVSRRRPPGFPLHQSLQQARRRPGTLGDELLEALLAPAQARGHRLRTLTFPVQEQAAHIRPRPRAPVPPTHEAGQVLQERLQPTFHRRQLVRSHPPILTLAY